MTSPVTLLIVDGLLLAALVFTATTMLRVQRRLRRLDGEHGEIRRVLDELTDALDAADATVGAMRDQGGALVLALGGRIEEARALIGEFERRGLAVPPGPIAVARLRRCGTGPTA